jgi:hypothetical protein
MAVILAAQTGLWSDPTTWIGGIVPGPGDVALPNGFTVRFDADIIVAELRRDTTGGATASGAFFFSISEGGKDNAIITADVYASNDGAAGQTVICGTVTTGTIIGTVYGNDYGPGSTGIASGIYGASNTGTGTLYVRATVQGSRGMPAVLGAMQYLDTTHASAKVRATNSLTEITLRHPDAVVPYQGDVRAETTYGAGDYTGTLAVIGGASMNTPFSGSTVLPPHTPSPGFDEGFDSGFGA